MKKITIVFAALTASVTVFAQTTPVKGSNPGAVSVYKSPDILTDKSVADSKKHTVQNADIRVNTSAATQAKLPAVYNQGAVVPVLIYAEPKFTPVSAQPVHVSTTKTGAQIMVPAPATQIIPAGSLKSSVPSQAPITTTTIKPVEVNNNASGATLVPMPVLGTGTGSAGSTVATTPVATAQQVLGQPKPAEVVVTPPSVINSVKKAAVKQ